MISGTNRDMCQGLAILLQIWSLLEIIVDIESNELLTLNSVLLVI